MTTEPDQNARADEPGGRATLLRGCLPTYRMPYEGRGATLRFAWTLISFGLAFATVGLIGGGTNAVVLVTMGALLGLAGGWLATHGIWVDSDGKPYND